MNLTTRYMGLTLKNPVVASASPLSQSLDTIRRLEDHGASAVVMFSLFEEQIRHDMDSLDHFMSVGRDSFGEALSYFPVVDDHAVGPTQYLELLRKASAAVDIPIIASLNGTSDRGWTDFATLMQEAGAKGIELNIYYIPTAMDRTGAQIEEQYLDVVARVKSAVTIPVAVKVGPYFSSFAHMAGRLDRAGADALVLFNRFYQPDFDVETREVAQSLNLSTSDELRLRLHWVALLSPYLRPQLAITGGVHTAADVVKGIMAGAQVVMMTSALLKRGIDYLGIVESDLLTWLESHEYHSIGELRGCMNSASVADPSAFTRANYLKVLTTYSSTRTH